MRVLARCLLIWLMALAVPMQGMAAASLRHCLPSHQRSGTLLAAGHSQTGPSHGHHATDSAAGAGAAHDAGPDKTADGHKAGKCSACAACCVALGLPAPAVRVPVVPADSFIAILRTEAPPSFVPGRLDRPPRRTLAAA